MQPDGKIIKKRKIKLSWLRKTFFKLVVSEGDPLWDQYIRAYFLNLIGSYIAPDTTTGSAHSHYSTILGDIEAVGQYLWTTMHDKRGKMNGMYALMVIL